MIEIGKYANLEIVKEVDFGVYLDGGPFGEILLPKSNVSDSMEVGDEIKVFIYTDSEDRVIATTHKPHATTGEFAYLKAKDVSDFGAFLDWGIHKDLFVPFREQRSTMIAGNSYLVRLYLDNVTDRVVATTKFNPFLKKENTDFEENQEIDIIIADRVPTGFRVVVNETHWGMLYKNEIFADATTGDRKKAFVKRIREDGLIDVSLQKQHYQQQIPEAVQKLLNLLETSDGFISLTDKSKPEDIYALLQMSKKNFKKAVGYLYKQKQIELQEKGIKLK